MGSDDYSEEDSEGMFDEVQLLPPDKQREKHAEILKTHLETLLLLTTTKSGREKLRAAKVYPIIRETHLAVEDEAVRHACDRLVQVIMRDEHEKKDDDSGGNATATQPDSALLKAEEDDEDYKIVEIG